MSLGFDNPRLMTPYTKLERNPTIYMNNALESDIQIATLPPPMTAHPFPFTNTVHVLPPPPEIPIRVVTPSHIIYENNLVDIKPVSPKPPPTPEPSPPPVKQHVNWFLKKELGGLMNILWLIMGISLALSIITITITITGFKKIYIKIIL